MAYKRWEGETDGDIPYHPFEQEVIDKQPQLLSSVPETPRTTSGHSIPRYGWFSNIRDADTRMYLNDLHKLIDQHKFIVGRRKDGRYTVSDSKETELYVAALRSDPNCLGCEVPKGPGIAFRVFTALDQPVLVIQTQEESVCLSPNDFNGEVKVLPDVSLGSMEGSIGRGFKLKAVSKEVICTVRAIYDGCLLCDRFYEIIPVNSPHDVGTVMVERSELLITFPRVLDVPGRALVLGCVISMKYQLERNGWTGPCKG